MPWDIHGISYGYCINYGSCKIQNGISQGYPRDIPRDTDSVRIIGYPWDIPGIYSAAWAYRYETGTGHLLGEAKSCSDVV